MNEAGQLQVLLVDDSAFNLRTLRAILEHLPDMEVVATADSGADAQRKLLDLNPDCVTIDLDMPRMEGLLFLRTAMSQAPVPVLVLGTDSQKQPMFQVLELGAFDFLVKPGRYVPENDDAFTSALVERLRAVRGSHAAPLANRSLSSERTFRAEPQAGKEVRQVPAERLVLLGASTGGPPAVQAILKYVAANTRAAVVVAQHMPEKFTRAFAERLNRLCGLNVMEAEDKMPILAGHAYIAPGGSQLEITGQSGSARFSVRKRKADEKFCPSVDCLFTSAASRFGKQILAVVLTGMGNDGSLGVRALADVGAMVIAESEQSAVVWGMPKEAVATGAVRRELKLEDIVTYVGQFAFRAQA